MNWIPCSERMPDKYGLYLVTAETEDGKRIVFDQILYSIGDSFDKGFCEDTYPYKPVGLGLYGKLTILAWMPYPEPYAL